jgi:hypothetical protein
MALPGKVKAGDPIRASDWNALIDFVRSLIPLPSAGIRVKRGASGTAFSVSPTPFTRSQQTTYDFTLTPVSVQSQAGVQLSFGNVTCNGGISLASGVNPYPEEFSADNKPPWTSQKPVAGMDQWFAYLIVTVNVTDSENDIYSISSISWDVFDQGQSDDPDSGTYYFLLGNGNLSPDGSSAVIANATGKGSQTFSYCGGVGYWDPAGPIVSS